MYLVSLYCIQIYLGYTSVFACQKFNWSSKAIFSFFTFKCGKGKKRAFPQRDTATRGTLLFFSSGKAKCYSKLPTCNQIKLR